MHLTIWPCFRLKLIGPINLMRLWNFKMWSWTRLGHQTSVALHPTGAINYQVTFFFLPPSVQWSRGVVLMQMLSYCSYTDFKLPILPHLNYHAVDYYEVWTPRQLQFCCNDKRSPAFHVNLMIWSMFLPVTTANEWNKKRTSSNFFRKQLVLLSFVSSILCFVRTNYHES